MSLAPGTILGHYRIARMIGSGGMGAVYDAVQLGIERHVAIKILHAKLLIRPDAVRRFLSEARAVNLVDHPSVVPISEASELEDGTVYLVMDFLRGESMMSRIRRLGGMLPAHEVVRFARQVAAAIGYVALCGFDRVSVIPFPNAQVRTSTTPTENLGYNQQSAIEGALRSVRSKKSSMQFFANLNALTAGGSVDLNQALRRGALEARHTGLAIVLSDFLDPTGYEAGLTALVGRGFQVNCVQILAPEEIAPTTFGDLRLVDSESGGLQEVTFGKYRMKAYQQTVQNFVQRLREYCTKRGMNFFMAPSNMDLQDLLLKQLRKAEVWG